MSGDPAADYQRLAEHDREGHDAAETRDHPWLRMLYRTREVLQTARMDLLDKGYNYSRQAVIGVPELHRKLHELIIDYYSLLAVEAQTIPEEIWQETITTVEVPKSGQTIQGGETDLWGHIDQYGMVEQLEPEEKPVRIATLPRDWPVGQELHYTVEIYDQTENRWVKRTQTEQIYLPLRAIFDLQLWLDQAAKYVGWTPPRGEEATAGDAEFEYEDLLEDGAHDNEPPDIEEVAD